MTSPCLLLLDVDAPSDASALQKRFSVPEPTVLRLTDFGFVRPPSRDALDFGALAPCLGALVAAVRALPRPEGRPLEILVHGFAPLSVFFAVGAALDRRTSHVRSVNEQRAQPGTWDDFDLSAPAEGRGPLSRTQAPPRPGAGTVGVLISSQLRSLPESALRTAIQATGQRVLDLAGLLGEATVTETNIGAILEQERRFLDAVAADWPDRTGLAVAIAGPASLALGAGLVFNPQHYLGPGRTVDLLEYAGGRYRAALRLPLPVPSTASPVRAGPLVLDLTYEILTPLFLSGVNQEVPELRVPSIRGAVRAWYRAIDPHFRSNEVHWFGAADQPDASGQKETRQSPWWLRVRSVEARADFELDRDAYRKFDHGRPPDKTNGVLYTGFSLLDRFNRRRAFHAAEPGRPARFTLRLTIPRPGDGLHRMSTSAITAVLGAFWALGHLGGLGSRGRRGWGSVQLTKMEVVNLRENAAKPPAQVEEVVSHLQPAKATTPAAWAAQVGATLAWLKGRFPGERDAAAAQPGHIGTGSWAMIGVQPHREWGSALNEVGSSFQGFRREQAKDRTAVGDALWNQQRSAPGAQPGGAPLRVAPRRVAFGLPLTFRFGITPKRVKLAGIPQLHPDTVEFQPDEGPPDDGRPFTRYPGLVSFRLVRLGDHALHPVIVRLAGAPPGTRDPTGGAPSPGRVRADVIDGKRVLPQPLAIPTAGASIVDEWRTSIAPHCVEVKL